MKPAGLREVERAKADGRWQAAYDPPSRAAVPEDLERALAADGRARAFFATPDAATGTPSCTASRRRSGRRRGHGASRRTWPCRAGARRSIPDRGRAGAAPAISLVVTSPRDRSPTRPVRGERAAPPPTGARTRRPRPPPPSPSAARRSRPTGGAPPTGEDAPSGCAGNVSAGARGGPAPARPRGGGTRWKVGAWHRIGAPHDDPVTAESPG